MEDIKHLLFPPHPPKPAISFTHALVDHLRFTQLHVLYPLLLEKMLSDVLSGKETH